MSAELGLDFARDIVFTYGPLGFLALPTPHYYWTFVASTLMVWAAHVAAVGMIAWGLSRAFRPFVAAVATYLVAATVLAPLHALPELLAALVCIACVRLAVDKPAELTYRSVVLLATLAAFLVLVKLNAGVLTLALVTATVAIPALEWHNRRRAAGRLGLSALTFVIALMLLWTLAGQPIATLIPYIDGSKEMVVGYASAMALEEPGREWEYLAALLTTALVAVLVVRATRPYPTTTRLLVGAIYAVFLVVTFREGFVRHDQHSALFFASVALVTTALLVRSHRKVWGLATLPPLIFALLAGAGAGQTARLALVPDSLAKSIGAMMSPSHLEDILRARRRRLHSAFPLSRGTVDLLRGATVHFDPYEAQMAWAYKQVRWRSPPVFQTFVAYTSELDSLNADFLASAAAPDFILRRAESVDQRLPRWDSPKYMLEMFCRYRPVGSSPRPRVTSWGPPWTVLRRGPNGCSHQSLVSRRRAAFGETVDVPPSLGPEDFVVARFERLRHPFEQRVRSLLLKPEPMYAILDRSSAFRFLPGHADSPHIMRFPECLSKYGIRLDTNPISSIGLRFGGSQPVEAHGDDYSVSFHRVPFDCEYGLR